MTQTATLEIPFERQLPSRSSRMCGAAGLCMVYRSLGVRRASQQDLWEQIARPDRNGTRAARTHLLAANALCHGLSAVCFEAAKPWRVLRRCVAGSARAILNHRVRPGSPLGHYTVLVGIDSSGAVLHDPQAGPNQRVVRESLLALWRPAATGSEVTGHVLVAIGPLEDGPATCSVCGTALPESVACPNCKSDVPLRPSAVLGCADEACRGRLWKRLFCPYCDATITATPSLA